MDDSMFEQFSTITAIQDFHPSWGPETPKILPRFISEDYLALGFMLFPNCKLQLQVMSAGLSRVERLLMQKDAIHDEVKNDELSSGSLGTWSSKIDAHWYHSYRNTGML